MTDQTPFADPARPADRPAQLKRSRNDRILAGVCGGIARWSGIDVAVVRILFVVLALFGGGGILAYLLCWLLIPNEGASQTEADRILQSIHRR